MVVKFSMVVVWSEHFEAGKKGVPAIGGKLRERVVKSVAAHLPLPRGCVSVLREWFHLSCEGL